MNFDNKVWKDPRPIKIRSNSLDHTDKRVYKVSVKYPAARDGKHILWLCWCDCGEHFLVRTNIIADKRISSCGKCTSEFKGIKFYPVDYKIREEQRDMFEGAKSKELNDLKQSLADLNGVVPTSAGAKKLDAMMETLGEEGGHLTELEQRADDEARHAHRKIVEGLSPEIVRLSAVLNEFGKMSTFEQQAAIDYLSALYLVD